MTPTAVLSVKGAKKRFGDVQALAGADLTVHAGEMLAVLGPNGAGKTTLVRAIVGRVRLDQGEMTLFDRPLTAAGVRPDLGLVPQEIALYPELTARENLDVFGRLNGLDRRTVAERAHWALDWTGLLDRADERTKTYSGGMKRRLNIACGVLHRPRLLILDEPTVAVDPQSREKIYDMLDALRREGTSILLTTHHLEEAEARCDRIAIIDKGKTVAAGTLAELVHRTVGNARRVTVRTRAEIGQAPAGYRLGADRRTIETEVADVARELGPSLARLTEAGIPVEDVDVRGPGLHAVFIHLTGAELRE